MSEAPQTAEKDDRPHHDVWCPLNGCRCTDCGPCAQMPGCPPRTIPAAQTSDAKETR